MRGRGRPPPAAARLSAQGPHAPRLAEVAVHRALLAAARVDRVHIDLFQLVPAQRAEAPQPVVLSAKSKWRRS